MPGVVRSSCLLLLLFWLTFGPYLHSLHAQQGSNGESATGRAAVAPTTSAVALSSPLAIDGHLDEPAWKETSPVADFLQQEPAEGAPATQRTEVRILFDNDALYVGARMYDDQGKAGVRSRLVRRDAQAESDLLTINLDPFHDHLRQVEFSINPAGVKGDASNGDRTWDPVWQASTRIDSLGWTAEIKIPFAQLRFPRDSVQTWGLQLKRFIQRNNENAMWAFWRRTETGGPAFYGHLEGLNIRSQPRRAEILPYASASASRLSSGDPNNPFFESNGTDFRLGADVKYLLTSNLTFDATINPDFGQVEVDPAVVNLTAFETFLPEKRPFFTEGANLFRFGDIACNIGCGRTVDLFYSRRAGRVPQGAALTSSIGRYADVPEATTILGAAKLTGRTSSGYSVGLMDVATRHERADVLGTSGELLDQEVEPATNYLVGRVKRDMRRGNLVLGGMVTSVYRDLDDPGLATLLNRHAESVGVDGDLWWGRRQYRLQVALAASQTGGDSLAILRAQRSSARYLQRPDAGDRSNGFFTYGYDPSATSMRGYGIQARLNKAAGSWLWDLNANVRSPGLETNDFGFLQRADYVWVNGSLGRYFTRPTSYYRTLSFMGAAGQESNFDGDVTARDGYGFGQIQLRNYWDVNLFLRRSFPTLDDRLTRGGPVVRKPGNWLAGLNLSTDTRKAIYLRTGTSFGARDDGGSSTNLSLSLRYRLAPNALVSVGPSFSRSLTTDQYVTARADPTAVQFYGQRYVFATLDQRTLSMETRANVTFTPQLSLETFLQPLIGSAHYWDYKEFDAPRRVAKSVYGRDVGTVSTTGEGADKRFSIDPDGTGPAGAFVIRNPDFNLRSLRGTAVLRWEWRPGSTAYFVWTQTRSESAPFGDLVFDRDQEALWEAKPDNIFLIKFTYWLGV